ncbi:MAG: hypothetical protein WBA57_21335 [Elainellaceae cyanobacterium]
MNTYRCTRSIPYQSGQGKDNLCARQGYYIPATNAEEAIAQMQERFPDEPIESFTVEIWLRAIESVQVVKRPRLITCPTCEGEGTTEAFDYGSPTMLLNNWLACYPSERQTECPDCDGDGEIEATDDD